MGRSAASPGARGPLVGSVSADALNAALELAVRVSDAKASSWDKFRALTIGGVPFSGLICQARSQWYGALYVLEVAGEPVSQFVMSMPKIHYPYVEGTTRQLSIPLRPQHREVSLYEKIDGTCIIAYPLYDRSGALVEVNYKTRRSPTVNDQRIPFSDAPGEGAIRPFRTLLDRLAMYDRIGAAVIASKANLAFELWGRANEHMVRYSEDLKLTLHTGIAGKRLLPPKELDLIARYHGLDRPERHFAIRAGEVTSERVAQAYLEHQAAAESKNKAAGENVFVTEGLILVLATERTAEYWKCKPESVEEYHWAIAEAGAGPRLNRVVIVQTLLKLDEEGYDFQNGGPEALIADLEDEFGEGAVQVAMPQLMDEYGKFSKELAVRYRVFALLPTAPVAIHDTREVMRWLAGHFNPAQMRSVFHALERYRALGAGERS